MMKIYFENNLLSVDNYKQIINITSDLILLQDLKVKGSNIKVLSIDPYKIVISGNIYNIIIGEGYNAIQGDNEQK